MIFDISKIIKDNYSLLLKDAHISHIILWLFGVPIITSVSLIFFNFKLDSDQLSSIVSFVSIIIGFLVNVSVILVSIPNSKGLIGNFVKKRNHANIFYTILVGILLVVIIIMKPWFGFSIPIQKNFLFDFSINFLLDFSIIYYFFLYSLFIHFILMILIVIKAFYALYK